MKPRIYPCGRQTRVVTAALALVCVAVLPLRAAPDPLEELLSRTSAHVSAFLNLISEVNCTERVIQEKLASNGKVQEKEDSTYDYLILLSNAGGELSLVESRLAPGGGAPGEKRPSRSPLLISNGFATLFLVFHPYYAGGFQFTLLGEETIGGRQLSKIRFQHIRGMRSPAALAVRGREYSLELSGTAWIDPQNGVIAKISAGVEDAMEDVGLRSLQSEVEYAPVAFRNSSQAYWLPARATVDVVTRRQHWRNTHRFSEYKRFSVNTKEQIAKQ